MKRILFLLFVFLSLHISGCSPIVSAETVEPPQIICGEGRNIVVSSEKYRFAPEKSGDIEPIIKGECFFYSPNGEVLIVENWDLIFRFKNEDPIVLTSDFWEGFTFYCRK